MARKRFDAVLKRLQEKYPTDVPRYLVSTLGFPPGNVQAIDADVSSVSAAADKVYRIGGRGTWLLHVEIQSSHNPDLARQLLLYNVLLNARHRCPVRSAVLLLRREADRGSLTGVLRQETSDGEPYLEFRYHAVRLWQQPVESLLTGGLGLLPLAPLADVPTAQLEGVVWRMDERIRAEADPVQTEELWATAYVLLGLEHSAAFASELLRKVRAMRESSTYRAIIAEGKVEALHEVLLELGTDKFSAPNEDTRTKLLAINHLGQLKSMIRHPSDASSWDDLLGTPRPTRRRRNTN